ncbi:phosphonates transport ATP-binding protein [Escherichia coli]|uniref:Phosphonates transport ATP-binding protein n=1 Tax=Escherichia coli TaxID=562 RepID=A0A2X3K635_ECOLX|nr:phosphonates transport ATP-binding protein [Escherichia coli]
MNKPLLSVNNLTHLYAPGKGFSDVLLIYGREKCWALSENPAPGRPRC